MSGLGQVNKRAFTLIEIMVVLALLGLMAIIIVPNLWRAQPTYERTNFITKLNALLLFGRQHAIITDKLHKVSCDFAQRKITLLSQVSTHGKERDEYKPVQQAFAPTSVEIPEAIEVKNLFIDNSGFDEMKKSVVNKTAEVWFFIVPEGLAQEVTMNFIDTKDTLYDGSPRPIGLVLNPFTVQFREYDSFQK